MNSSPTSLFDSYEQDFQQFIDTIREKLEGDGSDERGGKSYSFMIQSRRRITSEQTSVKLP